MDSGIMHLQYEYTKKCDSCNGQINPEHQTILISGDTVEYYCCTECVMVECAVGVADLDECIEIIEERYAEEEGEEEEEEGEPEFCKLCGRTLPNDYCIAHQKQLAQTT